MRVWCVVIAASALASGIAQAGEERPPLRFAWPSHAACRVELTDERAVGEERRTIVMTMRMNVEPDGASDRLVLRLSDARVVSIDGATPGDTDPAHTLLAVGRLMKTLTPTMVISSTGRYVETRDLDRLVGDVLAAAGFPGPPPATQAFADLLSDVAAENWSTWVEAWIGDRSAPGESAESDRDMTLDGATVAVHRVRRGLTPSESSGRTRLEASAVYPSAAVRRYTSGFLIDMAREAKELGDNDPVASRKFLDRAHYSPMTETLTVELDTSTMLPFFAERTRTFSATSGKQTVEGRERRTHRFTWTTQTRPPQPAPDP